MISLRPLRVRGLLWLLSSLGLVGGFHPALVEANIEPLLTEAREVFAKGDHLKALSLADRAIAAEPKNPKGYFVRGQLREAQGQHEPAIEDFTRALGLDPRLGAIYQHRGGEYFKLGKIDAALADFNQAIQLAPQMEPYFWQRGIADYYAARYEDGRRQFELHQTVNPDDVENAAWHFLCVARLSGIAQARASLLKIKEDKRVPMMPIYALFAGTGTADGVLAAARAGNPEPDVLKRRLFYAHLYLGLFYEATGNTPLAREHIYQAADKYPIDDYMADVARVHAGLLRKAENK
ncbi:MAG: tetratricopeptide repeat protein [Limisphaerales bacterium]